MTRPTPLRPSFRALSVMAAGLAGLGAVSVAAPEPASASVEPALSIVAQAPDRIHVSQLGSDGNPGTAAAPVRTVERALALAGPGDTVLVGEGWYPAVRITGKAGTAERPITVRPAPGAEGRVWFVDGDPSRNYGIFVENSRHIVLEGLNAAAVLGGVRIRSSHHIVYRGGEIAHTGQEGLAVDGGSSWVLVHGNRIHHTGQVRPQYGEGIYLGNGSTGTDHVHHVRISDNEIFETTGEAIDIKPAVTDVLVDGNRIHDISVSNSGAVVVGIGRDVYPDARTVIHGNRIWNITTRSQWTDGNAITLSASATVTDNVIWNVQHRGILADGNFVNPNARTVRIHGNTVSGWGIAAIEAWPSPNPAIAHISGNRVAQSGTFVDDPAAVVQSTYRDFFGRAPLPSEASYWSSRLAEGMPVGDYVRFLAASDMWLGQTVDAMYRTALGREADPGGWTYWTSQLRNGASSVPDMAGRFFGSAEYFAQRAGGDISAWVDQVYRAVLGRPADPAGVAHWSARAEAVGRGAAARELYQSHESRARRVAALYQRFLGRDPDPAGLEHWAGRLLVVGDVTLAVDLASSQEYLDRAAARY